MALAKNLHPPCWRTVAGSAFFAGSILLLALGLLSITVYEEPPFKLLAMMAATVHGPEALPRAWDVELPVLATAFAVHFGLALLYAAALACVLRTLPEWSAPWIGMAFGALLYYANLHGFTMAFEWFGELRTADTFVSHVVFGLLLARGVAPEPQRRVPSRRLALAQ